MRGLGKEGEGGEGGSRLNLLFELGLSSTLTHQLKLQLDPVTD